VGVDFVANKVVAVPPFPTAPLGDSDTLKVGDPVMLVGPHPSEAGNTVTTARIRGLKDDQGSADPQLALIRTDTAVDRDHAGGALVNRAGYSRRHQCPAAPWRTSRCSGLGRSHQHGSRRGREVEPHGAESSHRRHCLAVPHPGPGAGVQSKPVQHRPSVTGAPRSVDPSRPLPGRCRPGGIARRRRGADSRRQQTRQPGGTVPGGGVHRCGRVPATGHLAAEPRAAGHGCFRRDG